MKLDVLVSSLRGGGAERAASGLASAWAQAGHQVRLLTMESLEKVEYHPTSEVELISIAREKAEAKNVLFRVVSRLRLLRRVLTGQYRPDIVVAIQANLAIELGIACMGSGLKIIGCERNIPSRSVRGSVWRLLRPFAYRHLTCIMTQTEGSARELAPICSKTPIRVLPNILRLPLADNPPRIVPDDLVPSEAPLLLAVGRLVPAKGFDILLDHFSEILKVIPQARLVILGEGPCRSKLEKQIRSLGLKEGQVSLPGRAGNVAEWYERAQLFVMTSRWEGMPMVLIEAMAHGLVPVVTDFHHGPRDVIRDGVDGIILPEGDITNWVATISTLLNDNALRVEMGDRALEVRDRFGEEKIIRSWDGVFREVHCDP
jgi:glycosyltransferase involved in cell wall biosynthesis